MNFKALYLTAAISAFFTCAVALWGHCQVLAILMALTGAGNAFVACHQRPG